MAVFRIEKTRDYTVMSNHHLRDKSLSLKAKGLLSLMLSLPEEWDYTTKGLARICKDGVDSICAGVRELEEHGYVIRQRVRNPNGQLGAIEYTIFMLRGVRPFLSDKYDLTKHPNYKYTADADKKYLFDMERYMKRKPAIVKPDEPFEMYELTATDLQ